MIYNGLLYVCFAQFWMTRKSFASCHTYTFKYIFKFKKNYPLCLCFLIWFSEEEAEATKDFHMSISCLFKNKITVGNSQLCHTYAQIYSNLRKTTHSAFVFTFGFLKKWPKWHRTFICLLLVYLKNKTINGWQFSIIQIKYRTPKFPALDFLSFYKYSLC